MIAHKPSPVELLFRGIHSAKLPTRMDCSTEHFLHRNACWLKVTLTTVETRQIDVDNFETCNAYCYTLIGFDGFDKKEAGEFHSQCNGSVDMLHFAEVTYEHSVIGFTWTVRA